MELDPSIRPHLGALVDHPKIRGEIVYTHVDRPDPATYGLKLAREPGGGWSIEYRDFYSHESVMLLVDENGQIIHDDNVSQETVVGIFLDIQALAQAF